MLMREWWGWISRSASLEMTISQLDLVYALRTARIVTNHYHNFQLRYHA